MVGDETEVTLNIGSDTVASLGFSLQPSELCNIYTYQSGSPYTVEFGISTLNWHHVVLYWNHSTGLSSVTLDGMLLGQNINGKRSLPTGAPGTSAGVLFPKWNWPGGTSAQEVLLDNFSLYYY